MARDSGLSVLTCLLGVEGGQRQWPECIDLPVRCRRWPETVA